MEYVEEKAEIYELKKKIKTWKRKVAITSVRGDLILAPYFID